MLPHRQTVPSNIEFDSRNRERRLFAFASHGGA
jgi:hypothetical protein